MDNKKSYSEMLKDPRWQKKRLQIMNRDDFTCRSCGDKSTTLHVHHLAYVRNACPWEYEDRFLVTLCENCHEEETECRKAAEDSLLEALKIDTFATAEEVLMFGDIVKMIGTDKGSVGDVLNVIHFVLCDKDIWDAVNTMIHIGPAQK